jgi:hypothetical protein
MTCWNCGIETGAPADPFCSTACATADQKATARLREQQRRETEEASQDCPF